MARKLATVNKAAALYRCTIQVTTGLPVMGAAWRKMDDSTRCPNYSSNKPRFGPEFNNGNPIAVCAEHVAQIRGADAARSTDVHVIDACVNAASDAAWMAEVDGHAWVAAIGIVRNGWTPFYGSTLMSEAHREAAENAVATTLTERAMRLYPMDAFEAVVQNVTEELRGALGNVKPHLTWTVPLEYVDVPQDDTETSDAALRGDVIDAMVKAGFLEEVGILRTVADSMETREPTRADNTAWARGEMVTRIRRVPGMREAASVYREFRTVLDRKPVSV